LTEEPVDFFEEPPREPLLFFTLPELPDEEPESRPLRGLTDCRSRSALAPLRLRVLTLPPRERPVVP
jgi:hypothetical protein